MDEPGGEGVALMLALGIGLCDKLGVGDGEGEGNAVPVGESVAVSESVAMETPVKDPVGVRLGVPE